MRKIEILGKHIPVPVLEGIQYETTKEKFQAQANWVVTVISFHPN